MNIEKFFAENSWVLNIIYSILAIVITAIGYKLIITVLLFRYSMYL